MVGANKSTDPRRKGAHQSSTGSAAARFEDKPLIYAMAFNAASYAVLLISCEILEGLVVGYIHGYDYARSLSDVGGGAPLGILTTTLLLLFALLPFFGFRELSEVVGAPELHRLLFVQRVHLRGAEEV